MSAFLSKDFLLHSDSARKLYHEYVREMPIYDFHTHLSAAEIADNNSFDNITRIWLGHDHYKWRIMRTMGVDESLITGNSSDREKFHAWARVISHAMRNPLYTWTHMEMKQFFGIDNLLLSEETADEIYERCNCVLAEGSLTPQHILGQMNVSTVCTTDDPLSDLACHRATLKDPSVHVNILPTFRPDASFRVDFPRFFNPWIEQLETTAGIQIGNFNDLMVALENRINYFHDLGCRLSDHGLDDLKYQELSGAEMDRILANARKRLPASPVEKSGFAGVLLRELGKIYSKNGWTWQLHIGALRNPNTRMYNILGPDSGFDAMGDGIYVDALSRILNSLDRSCQLPQTILYPINPRDMIVLATLLGSFQKSPNPGKMQLGPAWWFNDHKDGIEQQLKTLSNTGLISCFIGMVTDSRSFLSFSRHDYFRRILCNLFGQDIQNGELPEDYATVGGILQDVCFNNAQRYFNIN